MKHTPTEISSKPDGCGHWLQRLVRLLLTSVSAVANAACIAAIVLWCLDSMGFWAMLWVSIAGGVARGVISGCLKSDVPNAKAETRDGLSAKRRDS